MATNIGVIVIGIVFTLLITGIVLIIYAPIARKKNARCSEQTDGVLLDIINKDVDSAGLVYVYSYHVNGIEYKMNTGERNPNTKNCGEHCTIWYNPDNPKEALAVHRDSNKRYKIILITGIAMISVVVLLFVFIAVVGVIATQAYGM